MTVRDELGAGWRLIVAGALGFGLGLSGVPFYSFGSFVGPLTHEFGWKVAMVQGGLTASHLTTMLVMPFVGRVVDRFGARPVALASVTLYSFAFMLLSQQTGDYRLYLANWALIGLCGTGTLAITWSRVISGAFDKGRGLALGLTLMGSGLFGIIAPSLAGNLIAELGWRQAYMALGCLPLIIALPMVTWLLHPKPTEIGASTPRLGLGNALRRPQFWMIGVSFMIIAGVVGALIPNLIKIQTSHGITAKDAAIAAGAVGLFVVTGRLACGALMDRFWAPAVAAGFMLLPLIAALALTQSIDLLWVRVAAAAGIGMAAGAEFDLLPFLISRYFEPERFGAVLGLGSSFFYFGSSLGAMTLGATFDFTGSYQAGLTGCAALLVIPILALLSLGRYLPLKVET